MVRGIDACSNEIGCRPEVFAQGYRYLSDILFTKTPSNEDFRLYMTYHAGEDFLDIVDGLRAIDEAVLFCGLHRGSRIGHALALGVNPFDYYGYKSGILTIEKQVLLDDIAWLLCKTEEVGSNMDYKLKSSLEEKFYLLFEETYGHILPEISIREYYLGWKLRGDNPEIYQTGIDRNDIKYHSGFNKYSLNPWIPGTIRGSGKKAAALFRAYHYDGTVYKKGSERCTFKIEENYAQAVYDLQEKMIRQIAYGGIAIESNPSSNYLIGTISKYEEHPIFRFNAGKLLKDVPETAMNVSINTDDQGVFDTMLENEYALMALALRKARDSEGYRYDIEAIYEWIDSVRKMGIGQVFR